MLTNFFRLNDSPLPFTSQQQFLSHFPTSNELRNVIYQPQELAPMGKESRFIDRRFLNCSFQRTIIRGVNFNKCQFVDCLFLGTKFIECEFHDCSFTGCNPYDVVFERTYIDPSMFENSLNPRQHSNIGVKLFHALLENAAATRQREFAASAEYNFRLWQRYQLNYERKKKHLSLGKYLNRWLRNFLYQVIAGYGLRAKFFVVWILLIGTTIWFMNWRLWSLMRIVGRDGLMPSASPVQALYFSVVTITTLGYGDLTPTSNAGMLMIVCEVLSGLVLLSIFASILIRRIVR